MADQDAYIKLTILKATGLEDPKNEMNAYCIVKCSAPKTKAKQTNLGKPEKSDSPEWNETMDFPLGRCLQNIFRERFLVLQ